MNLLSSLSVVCHCAWFVFSMTAWKGRFGSFVRFVRNFSFSFDGLFDRLLLRKEVIQPHLPVRLPCYDFTPLTQRTLDASFLTVKPAASGAPGSGGVTGGVYKARERIHRSLADLRLLAIPASCSRVAGCNPNWDRLFRIGQLSRASCLLCRPL